MNTLETSKKKLSNSLGRLTSMNEFDHGVVGQTDNGSFKITIYSNEIIRVQISQEESFDWNSYATVMEPQGVDFFVENDNGVCIITAGSTVLKFTKDPVRFSFLTKDGQVINEDDSSFGTSWIGEQVTTYKKLQEGERFIGLGEKTGPLDKKGMGFQNWNTDSFAYHGEQDPLYCTIPFYMGVHNELSYGIFFDNSHKSHFNFGASNNRFASFSADSGEMDYYFIYEGTVAGIIKAYSDLTGYAEVPPMWSLGYQQCRYSYYPEQEVYALMDNFRSKDMPADVIVFDIHYMDKYKIFSWDDKRFPDPKRLIKDLKDEGFHVVVMCDPGIKVEEGYEPYDDGVEKEVFIKYPDGENYTGAVWPGWCHFPDFTNPKTREWWKEKLKYYSEQGVEGYWNDMNEIATWGQTLPELMVMDFDGEEDTVRRGRNLYGLQMSRSTFEGSKSNLNGKRPFNLTRSAYSGIQRYGAVWTGDNVSSDEHMMLGVRIVNNLGLAGIPFTGYDVGGFVGNASEHLFARWIQIGALSPFFRGHTMINSNDSEPWTFGEEVEEISRNYIKLRYKLMTYLYSAFYEASQNALPVVRSLAIEHTHDSNTYDPLYENQYMFGPSLMVAPVESHKDLVRVYMPGNEAWYELFTDEMVQPGKHIAESPIQQLPIFVKAGSILPVTPDVGLNTTELGDTMEIHLYKGENENSYTYYEDDGTSYDYESGQFFKREIHFDPSGSVTLEGASGELRSRFSKCRIYFHGYELNTVQVGNESREVLSEEYKFILPISSFDPIGDEAAAHLKIKNLGYVEVGNFNDSVKITW